MIKKMLAIFLLAILPFVLFAGTTGKIAGVVRDKETGEPLAGANVQVIGTYLGTATDADGNYVLLNVPVGLLDIKVSYMGYSDMVKQGVRVSVDLTTDVVFDMVSAAIEGETVIVTAERPMIRKDETNTNILRSAEEIGVLPIRGMQAISASVAGVVKSDNSNTMNIRGGRGNENAIYVDGVLVNDPYNAAVRVEIPNEAIEELSVQTGGFNAEYGHAMSGIIIMTTNSGSDQYHGSLMGITDQFLASDSKTLGTYSYGYNEYVATLGGPILPGKRHTFFVSGTRKWLKDGFPSWGWAENKNKPSQFSEGTVPGQSDASWSFTGKTRFQILKSLELKTSAVYTDRLIGSVDPLWLYDVEHAPETATKHLSVNGTITHTLSPTTYYDVKLNYFYTQRKIYDREFGDDLMKYGDPTYVPDAAWAGNDANFGSIYSGYYKPDFNKPGVAYDDYFRNQTKYWNAEFNLTHQLGKYQTLKLGGDYTYHTLREIRLLAPGNLASKSDLTEIERLRAADIRFYGYKVGYNNRNFTISETEDGSYLDDVVYDASGNPTSGYNSQEPYHPITMSSYIQDKIEFADLVLNLGLRWDRIDANAWQFKQIQAQLNDDGSVVPGTGMFQGNQRFDSNDVIDSKAYDYISPRLGVSFPVSDNTMFHAQFGKFYQKPMLSDLYLSPFYLDRFVKSGGYFTNLDNPNLEPEKTTSYEMGFKRMLSENSSIQLTAFYKETEDLIQMMNIQTDVTSIAFSVNGDFGVIKGFDVIYNLRKTEHLSASVNYEFQIARGTGSASGDNFDIAWQDGKNGNYPKFIQPLSFEQKHTGIVNVDYRLGENEGPEIFGVKLFEKAGANLLFSFNSGQPYTLCRIENSMPFSGRYDNDIANKPISAVNAQNTPWNYRFDLKLDRSFDIPFGLKANAFVWVENLLNTKTVLDVWTTTGLPDDTGYLQTTSGQAYYNGLTAEEKKAYSMREMDYLNYGIPRQIRAGLQIEF